MQPLLLYDLTELQRHANRLYGFSAQETLDTAQTLYEGHKLISYPRTDSRHLSADVASTASGIVAQFRKVMRSNWLLEQGSGPWESVMSTTVRCDHHAIIPNAVSPERAQLTEEERKIYGLICRRFLMMWHDDYLQAVTTVITTLTHGKFADRYRTTGTVVQQIGWKVLDVGAEGRKREAKGSAEEKSPVLIQNPNRRRPSAKAWR
jgi:DNA topoisomerase III